MIIKKKEKRSALHAKLKHQKKKVEKRKKLNARDAVEKRALELVEEPPPEMIPRTIENTREADETVCKPNDEEERLAAKDVSKGVEEGFDPTQVRATSGVKKRQLKGLDIHTHSEDAGVSTSGQCPSRPSILLQSLQVRVQTCKEELRKLQEQYAALSQSNQEMQKSNQKMQKSLQFLYTRLGITPPPKMIPCTIENTREADETVCKPNDEEEKLAAKYVSKGMEEGFNPTQVRATSGVKKRQLKDLDIHTHSEDIGVSASRQCPSRPSILQQSPQLLVQTSREELCKSWEHHTAQYTPLSQSYQKMQKSLQFLYTQLGMTPPHKMIPCTIENTREAY